MIGIITSVLHFIGKYHIKEHLWCHRDENEVYRGVEGENEVNRDQE